MGLEPVVDLFTLVSVVRFVSFEAVVLCEAGGQVFGETDVEGFLSGRIPVAIEAGGVPVGRAE